MIWCITAEQMWDSMENVPVNQVLTVQSLSLPCSSETAGYLWMCVCVCLQTRSNALWVLITTTSHNSVNTSIENRASEGTWEFKQEDKRALILLYKHTQLVRRSGDHCNSCWVLEASHNLPKVLWVIEQKCPQKTPSHSSLCVDR